MIIGGGSISKGETLLFDRRIVALSKKKHPHVLFIPTASGESESYIEMFKKVYETKLGCKVNVLYLLHEKPSKKELRQKILSTDIIYVGGGNTLKMMKRWRLLGVDTILKEAYNKGIVCAGVSAGGICWFDAGHSDSMSFYHPDNWNYVKVRGVGVLKGIHCPHYNGETRGIKRKQNFSTFMKKHSDIGIAIDNHAAIEFHNGQFKVLHSKKGRGAYKLFKHGGKLLREEIPQRRGYVSTSLLYEKEEHCF